jgi:hypothetical protein
MTVRGGDQLADALRRMPSRVREEVSDELRKGAQDVLDDMRRLTPVDTGETRAALTLRMAENGLAAFVGLPTRELASDHFIFRLLDQGTQGGEFRAKRVRNGELQRYTVDMSPKPALRIRDRAFAANDEQIQARIRAAVKRVARTLE